MCVQGEELLWSTSESLLRMAIMETIGRFTEPPLVAAPASAAQQLSREEDLRRLLLGNFGAAFGPQLEEDDFT
jgi:hypothetical protein